MMVAAERTIMLQGDQAWWRLAETISNEDRACGMQHNVSASPEHRLHLALGPVPCVGAITTAPVVLLLSHPGLDAQTTAQDYCFRRPGWPLSALHPDAPPGLAEWWRGRLQALIDLFGAQHVSNAVAAVFLTPWYSMSFDDRLRLPSRQRVLDLAGKAAARDALLLTLRGESLWTEHPEIASLPSTRRLHPKSWRVTDINTRNLGEDAWSAVRRRIEIHAW
jgi:hypothetical protein